MKEQTSIEECMHPGENRWRNFLKICSVVLAFHIGIACISPQEGMPVLQNEKLSSGEQLFHQHCIECHSLEGAGGNSAPDLTGYGSKPWLIGLIQDPNAPKYYGNTKLDKMPEYDYLEEEVLSNLADFLLAQADEGKEMDPVLKETGEMILEENECYSCHFYGGRGGSIAPALDNFASDKWLRSIIEDPGQEKLFGKFNNEMPAFKEKLSKQEIDNLVYFLQSLRKKSY